MRRAKYTLGPGDRVLILRANGEVEVPAETKVAVSVARPPAAHKPPPYLYLLGTGGTIIGAAIGGPFFALVGMIAGGLTGHALEKPNVVR